MIGGNSESEMRESQCTQCAKKFQRPVYRFLDGREIFPVAICNECSAKQQERIRSEEEKERQAQKQLRWNEAIPPLYRESAPNQLNPMALKVVERFHFQENKGLYLYGNFGTGKTRAACMILRKWHDQDESVLVMQSTDFAQYCAAQFPIGSESARDARKKLDRCKSVGIFLLDDLGKERFTDRVETELFNVIESRLSNARSFLITSNYSIKSLGQRMSSDQGGAIIRRIVEFCHVVELK
jgi:DNA replication protein DnaC